jgi:TolB protein
VVSDLRNSGLFTPRGPDGLPAVSYPQVTAPNFGLWTGAQALVQGFVQAKGDGKLTVGCYLYDVAAQTELTRQGFVVRPARLAPGRAQMRGCHLRPLTGEGAYFDSRIVYVAESGPRGSARSASPSWTRTGPITGSSPTASPRC